MLEVGMFFIARHLTVNLKWQVYDPADHQDEQVLVERHTKMYYSRSYLRQATFTSSLHKLIVFLRQNVEYTQLRYKYFIYILM